MRIPFRRARRSLSAIAVALFFLSPPAASAQSLVQNGSFEDGSAGWTATGNQVVATSDPVRPASDGANVVIFNLGDLSGTAVLSQTFATVPGQRYGLSFDLGCYGGVNDRRTRVTLAGSAVLFDRQFDIAGLSATTFYVPQHVTFVADSTSTTLTFRDVTSSTKVADGLLDNVRVVAEPPEAPRVTSDPQRAAVRLGGTTTFTVAVSGTGPFSYQWQFGNSNIPGATGSSYTVTGATAGQAGNYRVRVTNAGGTVTSSAATLTVVPNTRVINEGFEFGSAGWTLSDPVIAEPTLNPIYQCSEGIQCMHFNYGQREAGGIVSQTIPTTPGQQYMLSFDAGAMSYVNQDEQRMRVTVQGNATLVSYTVSIFAPGNGTTWLPQSLPFVADSTATTISFTDISVKLRNVDLTLDRVRVSVANAPPAITGHPQSLTVAAGSPAGFSVAATGAEPLFYQWRVEGTPIPGAESSTYEIAAAQEADEGSYDVVVSNASGSVTSNAATLTVQSAGGQGFTNGSFELNYSGWTATGNQNVVTAGNGYAPSDGTRAVAFNGGQKTPDGVLSQTFDTLAGQSYTLAFDLGAMSLVNTNEQRLQVTVQGSSTLLTQTFSVFAPASGTNYVARSVSFVANSATTTLTFRDVSTVTKNVDLMLDNVRVTASGGQVAPTITDQPDSVTVTAGQSVSFSVTATGTGPLSYQWRKGGLAIGGATSSTYTIASAQASDQATYDVVVSNTAGSVTSTGATLTVTPAGQAPAITQQPQSLTVTAGSQATFGVTATGTAPLAYQWRKGGVAIGGATGATYTIASAQTGDAGTYDVVVSNDFGTATSSAATLTVQTTGAGAFTNGSFELDYAGWTATGNQNVVAAGNGYAPSDGAKAVAFNGGQKAPDGVLAQTFDTLAGQSYTLTFDAGAMSLVNTNEQRLQVTVSGTGTLLNQVISVSAPKTGTHYVPQSLVFVADSATTTVTFRDVSTVTRNVDLMLDNVRVMVGTP